MVVNFVLSDRLDRQFTLQGERGELISSALHRHHIPPEAVILRVDGRLRDVYTTYLEQGQDIHALMVRAYLLPELLGLVGIWPGSMPLTDSDPYYSKLLLWFNEDGECETKMFSTGSAAEFAKQVERQFIDGIQRISLIREGNRLGLALSGGRDSLALCYLLMRLRDTLSGVELSSATVESIAPPSDVVFASEVAARFDIPHHKISEDEAIAHYRFNRNVYNVLLEIKNRRGRAVAMYVGHHIIRTLIENHFGNQDISVLAYGAHQEDLFAAMLRSFFNGHDYEGPFRKQHGKFTLINPLWSLTKKEITTYLEVIEPRHNTQGSPTEFDRGAPSRDIFYLIADTVQTLWPGAANHLFLNHSEQSERVSAVAQFKACSWCRAQIDVSTAGPMPEDDICDACTLLRDLKLVKL